MSSDILWAPDPGHEAESLLSRFMASVNATQGMSVNSYEDLHAWSVAHCGDFWSECWDFLDVIGYKGSPVLSNFDDMVQAEFFPSGFVNFAENCLRDPDDSIALMFGLEARPTTSMTRAELHRKVSIVANWLRSRGIQKGHRVCAVVSNVPETIVCALATLSIGAVWSSVSPDFGVEGVVERFAQITPRVFFHSDHYSNKDRLYDVTERMHEIYEKLKCVSPSLISVSISADGWLESMNGADPEGLIFEKTGFNDPAFIMFSSGTTGKPKCIIHRHGVILQLMKEHQLHCDMKPNDRVFYYTTTTWMMWNWLVGALASRACIMLFEGNPFYPTCNVLFDFVGNNGGSFFGVSAKYIDSLRNDSQFRTPSHFASVRIIASTGSPLVPESFEFIYSKIKNNVQVASICGGTDILSCFILGCPLKPVKRGYAQCRGLGMDVQVWDGGDAPLRVLDGTKGELVCCTPFPSQPIGFWGDDERKSKYREAYFNTWPNVWKHGDFCSIDSEGHVFVYGRSDATLKPGGVRIGTAEIYRAVESLSFVKESICCGIELKPGDESIALFIVLKHESGDTLTDDMRNQIKSAILKYATRHHVPRLIEAVDDIPRTRSGKIVELAVKQVLKGEEIKNMNALANPESLEQFKKWSTHH